MEIKRQKVDDFFRNLLKYSIHLKLKKNLLFQLILKKRVNSAKIIQTNLLMLKERQKKVKYFENKKLFYQIPYSVSLENKKENTKTELHLVILHPRTRMNKYELQYCPLRDRYVAYLPKEKFNFTKIKRIYFKFVLNGKDCIDPNYEIVSNFRKGIFCNRLDIKAYENLEKNHFLHVRKKKCEYLKWECEQKSFKKSDFWNRSRLINQYLGLNMTNHSKPKMKTPHIQKHLKKFLEDKSDNNLQNEINQNLSRSVSVDQEILDFYYKGDFEDENQFQKNVNFSPLIEWRYYNKDKQMSKDFYGFNNFYSNSNLRSESLL